jgi:hypothetical protein
MNEDVKKKVLRVCLSITGSFEGASFGGAIGSFDGAGVSAFILQWNFLSTLRELLIAMFQADPVKFNELMTKEKTNVLMALLNTGLREDLQTLVNQITTGEQFDVPEGNTRFFHGGKKLLPDWKEAFGAVGNYFKEQQLDAAQHYFDQAIEECKTFKLTDERSIAFMFDICVQRGKHSLSKEQADFLIISKKPGFSEDDDTTLKMLTFQDAANAPKAWQDDVRSRHLCILNDGGIVHGFDYDLGKQFGLTDEKIL